MLHKSFIAVLFFSLALTACNQQTDTDTKNHDGKHEDSKVTTNEKTAVTTVTKKDHSDTHTSTTTEKDHDDSHVSTPPAPKKASTDTDSSKVTPQPSKKPQVTKDKPHHTTHTKKADEIMVSNQKVTAALLPEHEEKSNTTAVLPGSETENIDLDTDAPAESVIVPESDQY